MQSVRLTREQIKYLKDITSHLAHESPHAYESVRIKDGDYLFILYDTAMLVYKNNASCKSYVDRVLSYKPNKKKKNRRRGKYYGHDGYYNNNNRRKNRGSKKSKNNKSSTSNHDFFVSKYEYTIGSDETGKGEWYGPLIITATCTSKDENKKLQQIGVTDSKKLTKNDIEKLYQKIKKMQIRHQTLILRPFTYNKLYDKFKNENKNLNHLLAYLHSKAIKMLLEDVPSHDVVVIIDKFDYKKMNQYLQLDNTKVIQESNGERYTPVATSSIIAKHHYEKTLKELEEKYGVDLNKKNGPWNIDPELLDKVAKTHFKNISPYLKK